MIRALYRLLRRHLGDAQAIARGPAAHARRFARRRAHRELSRAMRRGGLLISGRSRRSKVLVRPPRAPRNPGRRAESKPGRIDADAPIR
jgi:hypothetical protein